MKNVIKAIHIILVCTSLLSIDSDAQESRIRYLQTATDNNAVWIATTQGLIRYDKASKESKIFSEPGYDNFTDVAISPDGDVTVAGNKDQCAAVFDGANFSPIKLEGKEIKFVWSLAYDNGLWIGFPAGIWHSNGGSVQKFENPNLISSVFRISSFAYDESNSTMWYAGTGMPTDKKLGRISSGVMTTVDDAPNIYDICIKSPGVVILATEDGLKQCTGNQISDFIHPVSALPIEATRVAVSGETVWFSSGNVLVKCNGNDFDTYPCSVGEDSADSISSITPDGDAVWITLLYGGLLKFENDRIETVFSGVESMTEDADDAKATIYNIAGQEITNVEPGTVYIQNGKKKINLRNF